MTIAAFIGAGGLGFLVFSGISSVNNGMILAGAIPACILALAIDWVLSQVESLVTPVSLQPELLKTRSTLTAKRRRQKWSVGVVVALLVFMFGQNVYANLVKDPNTISSEHRSMYSYVRLSIDRCTATYV